jgi:hypothetical protein
LLLPAAVIAADFRPLFNGKDLDGWVVEGAEKLKDGKPVWSIKDGMIYCQAEKNAFGFLRYDKQEFGDFALRVEYRFTPQSATQPRGNSGLGIRTGKFDPKRNTETRASYACYEIQLLDDAGKAANKHSTGSLYRYAAPTANPTKAAPEWNTIEVECVGPRIKIAINGQKVLDVDQTEVPDLDDASKPKTALPPSKKPLKGYVSLQSHTGTIEFRKVEIKEITRP